MSRTADPAHVRKVIARRAPQNIRGVLLHLLDEGVRMKTTKSGITVYAWNKSKGTAGTHWTASDARAYTNFIADLRRIGVLREHANGY